MKLSPDQKVIVCPHLQHSKHYAVLDCYGGKYPGIWSCQYGYSEEHEHERYRIEESEVDTMRNGEHDTYTVRYYVCGVCGVEIDPDVANPDEDRADAIADSQIMQDRDK